MAFYYQDSLGKFTLFNSTELRQKLIEFSNIKFSNEKPNIENEPLFTEENLAAFFNKLGININIVTFDELKYSFLQLFDGSEESNNFNILFSMEKTYFLAIALLLKEGKLDKYDLMKIITTPFHTRNTYIFKKLKELDQNSETLNIVEKIFLNLKIDIDKRISSIPLKAFRDVSNLKPLTDVISININKEMSDSLKNCFIDGLKLGSNYIKTSSIISTLEYDPNPIYFPKNILNTSINQSLMSGKSLDYIAKNVNDFLLFNFKNNISILKSYSDAKTPIYSKDIYAYNINHLFPLMAIDTINSNRPVEYLFPTTYLDTFSTKSLQFSLNTKEQPEPFITFFEFLYGIFNGNTTDVFKYVNDPAESPISTLTTSEIDTWAGDSSVASFSYLDTNYSEIKDFLIKLFPNMIYSTDNRKNNLSYLYNYFFSSYDLNKKELNRKIVSENIINELLELKKIEIDKNKNLVTINSSTILNKIFSAIQNSIDGGDNTAMQNFSLSNTNLIWSSEEPSEYTVVKYLEDISEVINSLRSGVNKLVLGSISDNLSKLILLDIIDNYITYLSTPGSTNFTNFKVSVDTYKIYKILKVVLFLFENIGNYGMSIDQTVQKFFNYHFSLYTYYPDGLSKSILKDFIVQIAKYKGYNL